MKIMLMMIIMVILFSLSKTQNYRFCFNIINKKQSKIIKTSWQKIKIQQMNKDIFSTQILLESMDYLF